MLYFLARGQRVETSGVYVRNYKSTNPEALPSVKAATGNGRSGLPSMAFFEHAKEHLIRDYILIIDRSGSMAGSNWSQARGAVEAIAPYTVQFDPDGVTLLFFSGGYNKIENVKSTQQVRAAFDEHSPSGGTNLSLALDVAFREHFNGTRGATTILVVTDGAPNSESEVVQVIQKAANSIEHDSELSISFIQVGADRGAGLFLKRLDDELECRFDIVDTVSWKMLESAHLSFSELIARSLYD